MSARQEARAAIRRKGRRQREARLERKFVRPGSLFPVQEKVR